MLLCPVSMKYWICNSTVLNSALWYFNSKAEQFVIKSKRIAIKAAVICIIAHTQLRKLTAKQNVKRESERLKRTGWFKIFPVAADWVSNRCFRSANSDSFWYVISKSAQLFIEINRATSISTVLCIIVDIQLQIRAAETNYLDRFWTANTIWTV